jgi:hypothetical protein
MMTLNRSFKLVAPLGLALLAVCFTANFASAQALEGKFTLPSATRWGRATLPAGDYSFTLDKDYLGSVVTVLRGTQRVALIPTAAISIIKSGRSEMLLENGTVREVSLPQIGVSLHYPLSHQAAPQEPQAAQVIPVTAAGVGR